MSQQPSNLQTLGGGRRASTLCGRVRVIPKILGLADHLHREAIPDSAHGLYRGDQPTDRTASGDVQGIPCYDSAKKAQASSKDVCDDVGNS